MKQTTNKTLTGIDYIDKYLVVKHDLLGFTNKKYSELPNDIQLRMAGSTMLFWEILASSLKPEIFQNIIESNYPEGYVEHLTIYVQKHGYDNLKECLDDPYSEIKQDIREFTNYITKHTNLWSFEITNFLESITC